MESCPYCIIMNTFLLFHTVYILWIPISQSKQKLSYIFRKKNPVTLDILQKVNRYHLFHKKKTISLNQ